MKQLQNLLVNQLILRSPIVNPLDLSSRQYKRDRELEYQESLKSIDLVLGRATSLSISKEICHCKRCNGEQYKVQWQGMDTDRWGESACPYSVGLHKAKIAIGRGGQFDVEKWNSLIERTRVDKPEKT